jgi:hypothetical protein
MSPKEIQHDRLVVLLAKQLIENREFDVVYTNVQYSTRNMNGEIDVLASKGRVPRYTFFEVKVNNGWEKAEEQYERWLNAAGYTRDEADGYIVSGDYLQRRKL